MSQVNLHLPHLCSLTPKLQLPQLPLFFLLPYFLLLPLLHHQLLPHLPQIKGQLGSPMRSFEGMNAVCRRLTWANGAFSFLPHRASWVFLGNLGWSLDLCSILPTVYWLELKSLWCRSRFLFPHQHCLVLQFRWQIWQRKSQAQHRLNQLHPWMLVPRWHAWECLGRRHK